MALTRLGAEPIGRRHPVLAVGSNASPAQLRRKFAPMSQVVPITAARVKGLIVGVSAHVARAGYIPATPVAAEPLSSDLWVTWLGDDELTAMDATEPNYQRTQLDDRYPVQLTGGRVLSGCWI